MTKPCRGPTTPSLRIQDPASQEINKWAKQHYLQHIPSTLQWHQGRLLAHDSMHVGKLKLNLNVYMTYTYSVGMPPLLTEPSGGHVVHMFRMSVSVSGHESPWLRASPVQCPPGGNSAGGGKPAG